MSTLRAALEEALAAHPDDLASHAAYADLLMEHGDPRGEFVRVQLALEDPACQGAQRQQLRDREAELLRQHERRWLGQLGDHLVEQNVEPSRQASGYVNRWRWRRGWLDEVSFWRSDVARLRALVRAPAARLLQRLSLGRVGYQEADEYDADPADGIPEGSYYPSLYVLRRAPFLANLRFLRVGEPVDFDEQYHNNRSDGEGLAEVVAAMPNVEELQVLADEADLEALFGLASLTRLQTLVLYHDREVYPLGRLAANPALAALQTLRVRPAHSFEAEGYLPLRVVTPLFSSPHLTGLRHLHLHGSSLGDGGVAELIRSGLLLRLETLDLRFGAVTDAGARMLANCPDTRRLKHLSLANNQLTDEGCRLLEALRLPSFRCDEQYPQGSDEYLMTGDME